MMRKKVCSDILPHFGVTSCLAHRDLLPLLNALPHEKSDFGFFTKPIPLEEVSPSATKLPPGSCSFAKRAEVDNMGSLRQIFGEAIGGVAVVLAPRFPIALLPRR
jgi:hypothetical protein